MEELLLEIGLDMEDILLIKPYLFDIGKYQLEKFIFLLCQYGCSKEFVKDILMKNMNIIRVDMDQLEYTLQSIAANGDLVEDVLLQLF